MKMLHNTWIWTWLCVAIFLCLLAEAFVYLSQLFCPREADRIFKELMEK